MIFHHMDVFIYPLNSWWTFGFISPLAVTKNVVMSKHIQVFGHVYSSLRYIHWSGIAGPFGNLMFNFLRSSYYFFLIYHWPRLYVIWIFGNIEKFEEYSLYSGNCRPAKNLLISVSIYSYIREEWVLGNK